MKVTELTNQLNDLKIKANKWLSDNFPEKRRKELIDQRVLKISTIHSLAIMCGEPFDSDEDLVRNICEYCSDTRKEPHETILEVGLYAIAFDIYNSTKHEDN